MLIYLSFLQSKIQHPIPAYSFWEYYIKNGIEEAGYKWTEAETDWAEGLMYSFDKVKLNIWKTEIWEETLKDIKQKHAQKPISVFLSYLYPHQVEGQAIKEIQKMGIPCVNFFCDNVREFQKAPKEYAVFDLNWVPEFKALEMYKKANYNFIHLPMPMWVPAKYREFEHTERYSPTFIGSKDIQRSILFHDTLKKFDDITLRGPGWNNERKEGIHYNTPRSINQTFNNQLEFIKTKGGKAFILKPLNKIFEPTFRANFFEPFVKPKVFGDDYFEVTKNSMITIGVNRYPSFNHFIYKPDTYSRLRDIEAPMLGACYLTEWTKGIEQMYEVGEEIEIYSSTEELIEKIKYLSLNQNRRNNLRMKGQKRALNEHNICTSLQKIKNQLNIQ